MKRRLGLAAGLVRSVPLAIALLATGSLAEVASARQAVFIADGPGPGGGGRMGRAGPPVSSRDLEGYAKLLKLTDDQQSAASELLDAMHAEYAKAAAEQREKIDAIHAEFQETRDTQLLIKSMPGIMKTFQERRKELETAFLEDVKLTLSPEQADQWPALERMRRRDLAGNASMLSGESVDLIRLVDELELSTEARTQVDPVLERYEVDFDRALIERDRAAGDQGSMVGMGAMPAPDEMMARMKEMREHSAKVRDVNKTYARQIQSLLPESEAATFDKALRSTSFPQVYAPGHATRSIEAALGFEDLSAEQQAALNEIKEAYLRELKGVNDKWAEAIEGDEMDPNGAVFGSMGGMTRMKVRNSEDDGENPEDAIAKATSSRRDLDNRTLDRIKGILSPEQQERLPKRQPKGVAAFGGEGPVPEGDVMIMEVSESHDGVNEPERSVRVSRPATGETTEVREGGGSPPPQEAPPATPTPPG